jgi:hypothetical protein
MENYVTLVAEIAEYPICVGENLRSANSVHLFVSRVNELHKVRTATCCICPAVPDRSNSDALKVQSAAKFRREYTQGCVWTDLYWDSNRTWLSDAFDGFVLGLKQHVAQ